MVQQMAKTRHLKCSTLTSSPYQAKTATTMSLRRTRRTRMVELFTPNCKTLSPKIAMHHPVTCTQTSNDNLDCEITVELYRLGMSCMHLYVQNISHFLWHSPEMEPKIQTLPFGALSDNLARE